MVSGRPNLGRILLDQGVVSEVELSRAIAYQAEHGGRLGAALVALGVCQDVDIARALAHQLEVPFLDLEKDPPLPSAVALIPGQIAKEFGVLPVALRGKHLIVAALDPLDIRADEAVRKATELPVILGAAPEDQLRQHIDRLYSEQAFEETSASVQLVEDEIETAASIDALTVAGQSVPTVKLVNTLIAEAVRRNASDVHIEPEENQVRVRYRIDGVLQTVVFLPRKQLAAITSRVKIMNGLDIAESRRPQDGGCRVRVDNEPVEIRCSTLPSVYGESLVFRLLRHDPELVDLAHLGMRPHVLKKVRRLLRARHGLFLITGPTGSGKSTSLYAGLETLNDKAVKVITVEDPVELRLQGVTQVQVEDKAGRTFARTLRSMMRQDPDVIMVGEIRDLETAGIAAQAALTGHMVLSTLHTQTAVGAPARLTDMGVAPYIVAAAVTGVLAQRLVQRVCCHCAQPYVVPPNLRTALQARFGDLSRAQFARGAGCRQCYNTGRLGRVGVFELLEIDDELRRLIADGAHTGDLAMYANRQGFRDMEEDAYLAACEGIIPPEGVLSLGMSLSMEIDPDGLESEEAEEPATILQVEDETQAA